ncbi:39S ribosomal protein L17, mitochondrial-like [Lytechinus variegatus]|uniref:39S ribosomal protein L17, mitochondrial-like n=1 Tax=Lytechinus variegatus TaxID=7654 RepID=UPI001BB1A0DE|nr:39S ribosomal protein L17, mitochondrial-like [Lytechinus variegatus]
MRRLRFKIKHYLRMSSGPANRIHVLRTLITALVKYERIELGYRRAFETQKYAERLIHVAKRGDTDPEAMKIADFWLKDKKQIHKLFKVLGPRFEDTSTNFTRLLRIPGFHEDKGRKMAFLEYAGNPYPPLTNEPKKNPDWLLNVLVDGAINELKDSKALEEIKVVAASDKQYQDNLEGIQYVVDMMAMAELKDGSSLKAGKNEGTPV